MVCDHVIACVCEGEGAGGVFLSQLLMSDWMDFIQTFRKKSLDVQTHTVAVCTDYYN